MFLRHLLIAALVIISSSGWSQCGPYVGHPVWPDTEGLAFVNLNECGTQYTGVVWDNGATGQQTDGLAVGLHTVVLYVGNTPVETLEFEVEQLEWNLNQQIYTMAGALTVSVWAEVPYCGTQIFNYHHCPVDPDQTMLYLLQDGIAVDSVSPVNCLAFQHEWTNLDFGYTYQTYVVDNGACGSFGYGQLVDTYSCEGAQMDLVALAGPGGNNGSIEVVDVQPDPLSLAPPPAPLSGTFSLFAMPDFELLGDQQAGTNAFWDGLPLGDYMVLFSADSLCAPVETLVTLDATTGANDGAANEYEAIELWPVPAKDVLYWNAAAPRNVWVTDLQGRLMLQGGNATSLDVADLQPGIYLLHFADGIRRLFVKE